MAGSKIEIELNVKDINVVKNLISLLEMHYEDLPEQLQNTLKDISENGINDFTVDNLIDYVNLHNLDMSDNIISDSRHIIKVNKALKTIYVLDKVHKIQSEELEHFSIKNKDHIIIEW